MHITTEGETDSFAPWGPPPHFPARPRVQCDAPMHDLCRMSESRARHAMFSRRRGGGRGRGRGGRRRGGFRGRGEGDGTETFQGRKIFNPYA